MTNTDPTGVHTFTSGTVNGFTPSPDGTFDTGVLMSGDSFQWQANVSGEVPYYCMLHTWMVGTIVVQGNGSEEAEAAQQAAAEAAQAAAQTAQQAAAAEAAQAAAASQPVVTNTITTVDESGFSQDCMATGCYVPLNAVVSYGDTVTMTNTDPTGVHTFTSGTVNGFSPNPSQIFDSGVLMSGDSFQWQANVSGEVPYYCMLHTWMVGTIVVQGSAPTPVSLIDLDVSMSKTTYDLGELVGFSISGNDFSGTQNVSVDVTDPTGNTVVSRSINISPNTPGEIEFRLSEDFKTGTYKITATTSDNGTTISETSNFKLKSQFNSFTISDVIVSDQQGNSSTLQAGEMGFIKVNLSSTKSIATLVTVNLFDSELTSIGIGSVQTTLASGESEIILSFMIPDDAAIGPADIYVNAFSDWPSSGGTALTGELTSMEDIS
jgi:plastocyanin